MTDTKPELSVTEALAAADGPDLNLRPLPGSRMLSLADIEKLADDGDRQAIIAACGIVPVSVSLWPTKDVERKGSLRYEWTVVDDPTGEVLARGRALFESWAWHRAGRAAARIYRERHAARKDEGES